ncbi:Conserved_hypothetical protein [Hexamita inflata]|uniref:Uncharacterized protein n=1 Tax=Hexamita inflata TaxID=28002 RepID=A0AA86P8S3_9EUKA|nr:Conserved hypothetical protein [Hexamita inflata]
MDISSLYTHPFLDKLELLEQKSSLQEFSVGIKLVVCEQKLQAHKSILQQLKLMKMNSLQLKEDYKKLNETIQLQNESAKQLKIMNAQIDNSKLSLTTIQNLTNIEEDIKTLQLFITGTTDTQNLDKQTHLLQAQFVKLNDQQKLTELIKRHQINQIKNQKQGTLGGIWSQFNNKVLEAELSSLCAYLDLCTGNQALYQFLAQFQPVRYKQLVLQLINRKKLHLNTDVYECVYDFYNQYKKMRLDLCMQLGSQSENYILFSMLQQQFLTHFLLQLENVTLHNNQKYMDKLLQFLAKSGQICAVLEFFTHLKCDLDLQVTQLSEQIPQIIQGFPTMFQTPISCESTKAQNEMELVKQLTTTIKKSIVSKITSLDNELFINPFVIQVITDQTSFTELQLIFVNKFNSFISEIDFNANFLEEKEKMIKIFDTFKDLKTKFTCDYQNIEENIKKTQQKYLFKVIDTQKNKKVNLHEIKIEWEWIKKCGIADLEWEKVWARIQEEHKEVKEELQVYEFDIGVPEIK